MPDKRKTIFISCGQFADHERELGKAVCELVDHGTLFQAYFAERQTSLKALSENILKRLYEAVGIIVIMHHRGTVESPDGQKLNRASVWIEQEVAIATLMEQVLHRPLHVALFIQHGIATEGMRQQLQLNSIKFSTNDEVIAQLRDSILPKWTAPLYVGDEELSKQVESVDLSIAADTGNSCDLTIQVENHSQTDVEIKSIVLWNKDGTRICKPAFPQNNYRWLVPAKRSVPIRFSANEDLTMRLARIYAEPPPVGIFDRKFKAEIRIELRCEILGFTRKFDEASLIQVDVRNHHIAAI